MKITSHHAGRQLRLSKAQKAILNTVLAASALAATPAIAKKTKLAMESVHTQQAITIDGVHDKQWDQAKPLEIILNELPYEPNNGYDGIKETTMEVRSLYDDEYLYMYYRWYDPTYDLQRFPWEKQKDGSWKHLKKLDSTKHENTYYEDKLSVFWNINEKGFQKKGCDKSCHMVEKGLLEGVKDDSSGRHFTRNEGEIIDEWQWKGARTNPNFQLDDGFVDHEHNTNKKWGRHPDEKTGGGYYNNFNKDKTQPAWMNSKDKNEPPYWVYEDSKIAFDDSKFKTGARVGGIVTAPITGSRGDATARGEWKDDHWILEVKRKLVTKHKLSDKQDLQFDDLSKAYYFGVTAFDNSQINHLYHKKSVKLTFKK